MTVLCGCLFACFAYFVCLFLFVCFVSFVYLFVCLVVFVCLFICLLACWFCLFVSCFCVCCVVCVVLLFACVLPFIYTLSLNMLPVLLSIITAINVVINVFRIVLILLFHRGVHIALSVD